MADEYIHKWMYSFLPRGEDSLYLLGFCPECRNAVSVRIAASQSTGTSRLTETDLPRFGCVEPLRKDIKVDGIPSISRQ